MALPAWLYTTLHPVVPEVIVIVAEPLPLPEQPPFVVIATGRPDEAVAPTLNVEPYVAEPGAGVVTEIVWLAFKTSKAALSPLASDMPLVRVALKTTPFSAFEYVIPVTETAFVPLAIVPVTVPPSDPVPVTTESWNAVALLTFVGVPAEFWVWTTTENELPNVGLVPPLTDVIASLLAGSAVKAAVIVTLLFTFVEPHGFVVGFVPVPLPQKLFGVVQLANDELRFGVAVS